MNDRRFPASSPTDPISATRPTSIRKWWLRNRWDNLTFVHWAYEPDVVQALLPDGLTVDTFDGKAYVSLVPFEMNQAIPRFVPPLAWVSSFAETNVRTYVVDSAGNRAVWFFSLEADRLLIVVFARWLLGFPYVWSKMSVHEHRNVRRYETTRRRWPEDPNSSTIVEIEVGDEIAKQSDVDDFLTARWGTVAEWGSRLRYHPVDHAPWKLREATLTELSDTSFVVAGLPAPISTPIVRWVEGIDARFGRPVRV